MIFCMRVERLRTNFISNKFVHFEKKSVIQKTSEFYKELPLHSPKLGNFVRRENFTRRGAPSSN